MRQNSIAQSRSLIRGTALLALPAVLLTVCFVGSPTVAQQDERAAPPRKVEIDWPTAALDALALSSKLSAPPASKVFSARHHGQVAKLLGTFTVKEEMLPLAHLSELAAQIYPGVRKIPIPVLVPVDTARFVAETVKVGGHRRQAKKALFGASIESMELLPGLSGYDAEVTIKPTALRELGIAPTLKPSLSIAGSALFYGDGERGQLIADLQDAFPGLRRSLGSEDVTYRFQKYGVPYFVNASCTNGPPDAYTLSCTQAEAVIRIVLRDLRLVGGGPLAIKPRAAAAVVVRPTRVSLDFKYYAPGSLLPGTSVQNKGGVTNPSVHGNNLLFPIKDAPVYANSQVFMHWGDCFGQKQALPKQPGDKFARYKCRQNGKVLFDFEGHSENYSYPWRDNYCEDRGADGAPDGCPVGKGHEGQDIRASRCLPDPKDSKRCAINKFDTVAVGDGSALWKQPTNHLKLIADDGANKLYYLYLHMSPEALSDAGMQKGKFVRVKRGQTVGKVGNYDKTVAGGTSTHLHFEVRTSGMVPLSPYLTLIRAYEQLIGAQGTQISEGASLDETRR
jgi:hypothetical protein